MTQTKLFETEEARLLSLRFPLTAIKRELERRATKTQQILTLLRSRKNKGASNVELSRIALKYTSRISELRQAGHKIVAIPIDPGNSVWLYKLITKLGGPGE